MARLHIAIACDYCGGGIYDDRDYLTLYIGRDQYVAHERTCAAALARETSEQVADDDARRRRVAAFIQRGTPRGGR